MILILRFIGVMNAAVWFGSAVGILVTAPVFFSTEVQATPLGSVWPGVMVTFVFERFFFLQCVCALLAIAHQLAEWVYLGRALQGWVMALLAVLLLVTLVEGFVFQPRTKALFLTRHALNEKYAPTVVTKQEAARAGRSFSNWHAASRVVGLLATAALGVFLWKVVHSGENPRFVSSTKFRS